MIKFGGNKFNNFSVPLAFEGRYFILEISNEDAQISVVLEHEGKAVFEVYRNEPKENPLTIVTKTKPGIITVSDKKTNAFIYKIRPSSETSVVFGTIKGDEINARITDKMIQVGGVTFQNNTFNGIMAGVVVYKNGGIGIGASIPRIIVLLLR